MRLIAALLALFSLAQPARAEADVLICRMSGAVMHACRCPEEPAQTSAQIRRTACCDTLHLEAGAQVSRADDAGFTTPLAPLWVLVGVHATPVSLAARSTTLDVGLPQPRATTGPPRVPVYLSLLHLLG